MTSFKEEEKMQSKISSHRKKCSCGHSINTLSNHKRDYIICNWCGKTIFKDDKKQEEQEKKNKLEEFRMNMWKTMAKTKSKRRSHER